jgi:SnoaL-like domain
LSLVANDVETRLCRLEDRALISERVIRYAMAVDQRDWRMFADCFTDPVHADYSENGLPAADFARDDLVEIVRSAVTGYTATQHLSPNHVIEFDAADPNRAICFSTMYAQHHLEDGAGDELLILRGSYTNHVVRAEDGWRIERLIQHISWREVRRTRGRVPHERLDAVVQRSTRDRQTDAVLPSISPDHHPRTLVMAAKASCGVWSTTRVVAKFWLLMVVSLAGFEERACGASARRSASARLCAHDAIAVASTRPAN